MKVSRRRFIVSTAVVGGGVLIGYSATRPSRHSRANKELTKGSERFITSFIKLIKKMKSRFLFHTQRWGKAYTQHYL